MPAIARLGDMSTGHQEDSCFWPPKPVISGSSNVFVNGLAAITVGSEWQTHCCSDSCHSSVSSSGSSNVFINGRAAVRIGDQISCSSNELVASGSSNVFIN
jgi:uncharacterized Zn-binding protein involved in type VI secretion